MGVCLSEASFAHLAMTGILKGMGVSGGCLFLGSFFFGGTKKNEYMRASGTVPAFCLRRKKKYIRQCKRHVYRMIFGSKGYSLTLRGSFPAVRKRINIYESVREVSRHSERTERKSWYIISTSKKIELKIIQEDIVNYLGIHIHLYKNVKIRCLCAACIGQALLSMQKMYYNI